MPVKGTPFTKRTPDASSLRRAISDVMDGTLTVKPAAKAHNVTEYALRSALTDAGYVPPSGRPKVNPVRRRTFGDGKRHGTQQLPPRRSDNSPTRSAEGKNMTEKTKEEIQAQLKVLEGQSQWNWWSNRVEFLENTVETMEHWASSGDITSVCDGMPAIHKTLSAELEKARAHLATLEEFAPKKSRKRK